jgi:lysophospholipase L1-like esterase
MVVNKNQIFKLAGVVLTCAVIAACSSSDPTAKTVGNSGTQSSGTADFSKFVAIGDSLTAGYADGALYLLGQQNSFPLRLAEQFAAADGVAVNFTQPLVSDNLGGLLFNGVANPEFDNRFALNTVTQKPERIAGTPTTEVIGSGLNGTSFNNMGVPGAKSFHLGAPGYGEAVGLNKLIPTANPYFVRFSLDFTSTTETVIGDAAAQLPSFFTLWIGNNDVLSYATSGGIGADSCNPLTTACGSNDITDPSAFGIIYTQLVGALTTGANANAKGVLINIPDVSTIPYFTAVPYNPVPLDQASADQLNAAYAPYNAGIQQAFDAGAISAAELAQRTISFTAGQNAVVIEDETLTPVGAPLYRQATASDLIVLPTGSKLGTESVAGDPATIWGLGTPLVDADVLIPSEILAIDTARTAFNATIKAAADNDANLAFFDAAAIMKQLSETGIDYGTGFVNADFATGGAFSLDGVHPTARGYALIANKIIDVINSSFNANVYKVDPATYPAVLLK